MIALIGSSIPGRFSSYYGTNYGAHLDSLTTKRHGPRSARFIKVVIKGVLLPREPFIFPAERAAEAVGDVSLSAGARTATHTSGEGWSIIQIPRAFRPSSHLLVSPLCFVLIHTV